MESGGRNRRRRLQQAHKSGLRRVQENIRSGKDREIKRAASMSRGPQKPTLQKTYERSFPEPLRESDEMANTYSVSEMRTR